MKPATPSDFNRLYETHLKHLKLKGLQPKTIEAYARAIRRIGAYFDHRIDDLSEAQLIEYFTDLLEAHSWSAVKLDLFGTGSRFPVSVLLAHNGTSMIWWPHQRTS